MTAREMTPGSSRRQVARMPEQDPGDQNAMGELASLPGLDEVRAQLADVIAVVQAEVARRQAGIEVSRRAWKNLVFIGGPGSGKSRVAQAVGRIYRELGVLELGCVVEVASADLVGTTGDETGGLVRKAAGLARGGVLMVNDVHPTLEASRRQIAQGLLEEVTYYRDDLLVILAGQYDGIRRMLHVSPALASRFAAVIKFPGYSFADIAAIFDTLAREAGFVLSPGAARKAAAMFDESCDVSGGVSARLAVHLLQQATANQARRIKGASELIERKALSTMRAADIPDDLDLNGPLRSVDDEWPGQYL